MVDAALSRPTGIGPQQCSEPVSLPFLAATYGFALVAGDAVASPRGVAVAVGPARSPRIGRRLRPRAAASASPRRPGRATSSARGPTRGSRGAAWAGGAASSPRCRPREAAAGGAAGVRDPRAASTAGAHVGGLQRRGGRPRRTTGARGGPWFAVAESPCRHLARALGSPAPVRAASRTPPAAATDDLPCRGSWRRRDAAGAWAWRCDGGSSGDSSGRVDARLVHFWGDSIVRDLYNAAARRLGPRAVLKQKRKAWSGNDNRTKLSLLGVAGKERRQWHARAKLFPRGVLVANFGLLHEMEARSLNDTDAFFASFAARWRSSPGLRLVFVAPPALHKFRKPHCTDARAAAFGAAARRHLEPAGWTTFDYGRLTRARPDASADGMHYSDDVNDAAAALLLGHLGLLS
ncbi:hypothetical protein SO694_00019426 [Aureococcus anophagefferens]|uniref:SGNH hydrolase-type esterase domain-containing protein n=1 Tax=Aureococcus anophagefferens TaxID=44056 RepID=A0ABR1G0F0_AURAN